ncbi:MAG: helix-turn-helix transcriptional regulator [Lachnospiraceae bacterium]|nr:helix-turn-helix transcriptional regulator [Lachnospiraceae bacterium]
MRNFADKLYSLRTQGGYSQEALAEKVNVSRQAISKWELGLTLPDTDKIVALSKVFDVTIDYLLKDEIKVNKDESLDRLVLKFLGSAQDMEEISKELVDIMQDGVVDDFERRRVNEIVKMLDDISAIIDEIKTKMSMQ